MFNLKIEKASAYVTWSEKYYKEETLKIGLRAIQFFALHNEKTRNFWFNYGLNILNPATIDGFADYMQVAEPGKDAKDYIAKFITRGRDDVDLTKHLKPIDENYDTYDSDLTDLKCRDRLWRRIVWSEDNLNTYAMSLYIKTIGTMLFLRMFKDVDFYDTPVYNITDDSSISRVAVKSYSSDGFRSIVVGLPDGLEGMKRLAPDDWALYFKTLMYLLTLDIDLVDGFFEGTLPFAFRDAWSNSLLKDTRSILITKDLIPTMLKQKIMFGDEVPCKSYYSEIIQKEIKDNEELETDIDKKHDDFIKGCKTWNNGWRPTPDYNTLMESCFKGINAYSDAFMTVNKETGDVSYNKPAIDDMDGLFSSGEFGRAFRNWMENRISTSESAVKENPDLLYEDENEVAEFQERYLEYKSAENILVKAQNEMKSALPTPTDVEYWVDNTGLLNTPFTTRAYYRLWTLEELLKAQKDDNFCKWISAMIRSNGNYADTLSSCTFSERDIPFRNAEEVCDTSDYYILFDTSAERDKRWNYGIASREQLEIEVLKDLMDKVYSFWTPVVLKNGEVERLGREQGFNTFPYVTEDMNWFRWGAFVCDYLRVYMKDEDIKPFLRNLWGLTLEDLAVIESLKATVLMYAEGEGIDISEEQLNNLTYSMFVSLRNVSKKSDDGYSYDEDVLKLYCRILGEVMHRNPEGLLSANGKVNFKPLNFNGAMKQNRPASNVATKPETKVKLADVLNAPDNTDKFKDMYHSKVLENVVIRGKLDTFLAMTDCLVEYKKGSALVKDFEGEPLLVIPYAKFNVAVSEIVPYEDLEFIELHNVYYELDPTIKEDAFEKLCIVCKNTTAKEVK